MTNRNNSLLDILRTDVEEWIRTCKCVFSNERDLQVKLAIWLESRAGHYSMVDTEYCVPTSELRERGYRIPRKGDNAADYPDFPWHNEISLDIVVGRGDEYAVVELKYFTRPVEWEERIFGEALLTTTTMLKDKAAIDVAMYGYCKDVRRVELVTEAFSNIVGGIALIVANNHNIWEKPKGTPLYLPFSLHEGNTFRKGFHGWGSGGSEKFKNDRPGFNTSSEYTWRWHDTSIPYRADNGDRFRYLITEITKNQ